MPNSNIDDEWESFITSSHKSSDDTDSNFIASDAHYAAANNNNSSSNDEFVLNKLNNKMTFSSMCTTSAKQPHNVTDHQRQCKERVNTNSHLSETNATDALLSHPSSESSLALGDAPTPTDIYISTKSKIEYLNSEIDIKKLFWDIKIMPYSTPMDGIIKKQIKFNSLNLEELNLMQDRLKSETYYEEHVLKSINNPDGRIKFKDIRKLSVGIAKKDIMSYRSKKKSAFYNCFVMILRIKFDETFKEFHVKIFNTGKIELTGMQSDEIHSKVLKMIMEIMHSHVSDKMDYLQVNGMRKSDTILINSNFNCGFYINREALYSILKHKYNIDTIYDPCSYPGIQCKFYYNVEKNLHKGVSKSVGCCGGSGGGSGGGGLFSDNNNNNCVRSAEDHQIVENSPTPIVLSKKHAAQATQAAAAQAAISKDETETHCETNDETTTNDATANPKIIKVSFMIFRTGSVLIVGMCNENVLIDIYDYIKLLLQNEYSKIAQINQNPDVAASDPKMIKQIKIRKKTININFTTTGSNQNDSADVAI